MQDVNRQHLKDVSERFFLYDAKFREVTGVKAEFQTA